MTDNMKTLYKHAEAAEDNIEKLLLHLKEMGYLNPFVTRQYKITLQDLGYLKAIKKKVEYYKEDARLNRGAK